MQRMQRCVRGVGLVMLMLAALLIAALLPSTARAGASYGRPYGHPMRDARPGAPMALVGTVVEVVPAATDTSKGGATTSTEAKLVLELEQPAWVQRGVSRQLTLAVDDAAILLAADLAPLELASLAAGDTVMIMPKMTWGTLAVQLLYAGTAEELAAHSYHGRLVSGEGDTLQLQARWDDDPLTVVVDAATIWFDHEPQARPADLPKGIPLRVLGVEQDDGSVRAVVVAAGRAGL